MKKLEDARKSIELEFKAASTSPVGLTGSDQEKPKKETKPSIPKQNKDTDLSDEQFIKSLDKDDFYDLEKKETNDQAKEIESLKSRENQRITDRRQEKLEQLVQ